MKVYVKVFVLAFVSFLALFGGVYFGIETFYHPNAGDVSVKDPKGDKGIDEEEAIDLTGLSPFERAVATSKRVNVIAFGLNDMLADTMMFISFDPEVPRFDAISIPRDTFHEVEGFNHPAQKKMNAVYGLREIGGPNGMKHFISEFLGVPIDYYVRVDLDAVAAIVDTLGGYNVYVPPGMTYTDTAANPPLYINLKEGQQTLNGADTVKFLRFRQNNSGTIRQGDIQRIPKQQEFVDAMIQQAIGAKLPSVINTIIASRYIRTDMTLEEALGYSLKAATLKKDQTDFYLLEGEAKTVNGASYWFHDPERLEEILFEIYGVEVEADETDSQEESTEEDNG